jgi:hypothetical protein
MNVISLIHTVCVPLNKNSAYLAEIRAVQALRRRYAMAYMADRARGNRSSERSIPSTSLAGSKRSRRSAAGLSAAREVSRLNPPSRLGSK